MTSLHCMALKIHFHLREDGTKKRIRVCHSCQNVVYIPEGTTICPSCTISGNNKGEGDNCPFCQNGVLKQMDPSELTIPDSYTPKEQPSRRWWEITATEAGIILSIVLILLPMLSIALYYFERKYWYVPISITVLFIILMFLSQIVGRKSRRK